MPGLESHEKKAIEVFGEPWTKVHKWLDEFAIDGDGRLIEGLIYSNVN